MSGVKVVFQASPLPPPADAWRLAKFATWAVLASIAAVANLMRGRWWHIVLLGEAASAAAVRLQPRERLAAEYLFHNSGWIQRPLWTYEVERAGSRVSLYFYSTNCEGFKRRDGYPPLPFGWHAVNWPRYLVWDEPQAAFIRRAVGPDAEVCVAGPIWFSSSPAEPPALTTASLAVFDITPFRSSFIVMLAEDFDYYRAATAIKFLDGVRRVAQATGMAVLWKRKREIGSRAHPAYRRFSQRFVEEPNVIGIDTTVSAYRLIENSNLVVSMPFTSTALIARELGKPSCYFDPTGRVQKDDRAAHGIPVIHGTAELHSWVEAHRTTSVEQGTHTGRVASP